MNKEEILNQIARIFKVSNTRSPDPRVIYIQSLHLLKVKDASGIFYKYLACFDVKNTDPHVLHSTALAALQAFSESLKNGLIDEKPMRIKIQGEVISDLLAQAEVLLDNNEIHPSASVVIIGASLEAFLRNWCLNENIEVQGKPSLDTFSKALKENELITKQDVKDLTSWGGLRNSAAHGNFAEVEDRNRIRLMLEGVNLFIRKCT